MARTAKALPSNLSALTGTPEQVHSHRVIPDDVKTFINNAIDAYELHTDYLRLPKEGQIPAPVIDTAVDYGRDFARGEGYKLLTRGYEKGKSTHLVYRVKLFDEPDDE